MNMVKTNNIITYLYQELTRVGGEKFDNNNRITGVELVCTERVQEEREERERERREQVFASERVICIKGNITIKTYV